MDLKLVFLKNFASHVHAFDSYLSMPGGFYAKIGLFFKTVIFLEFQLIEIVFRSIKIDSKIFFFGEPLSVSIN